MSLIYAPWTDEQVAALNRWQAGDNIHPFTCPFRDEPGHKEYAAAHNQGDHGILVAENAAFRCPVCDTLQPWAHDFMLTPPPEHPLEKMRKK